MPAGDRGGSNKKKNKGKEGHEPEGGTKQQEFQESKQYTQAESVRDLGHSRKPARVQAGESAELQRAELEGQRELREGEQQV